MSYNILLVDDSMIIRAVVKKTLTISKIDIAEFYEATNGKEALRIMETKKVDIVLTDINMPVMNGVEMIENMIEKSLMDKIMVIVISTERSLTRVEYLHKKGIKGYLNKPFMPEEIEELIGATSL